MGEALAEAELAIERGERPIAAVAVVDEAMVARAHDRVEETNDPTAHAVVVALREAARRLGRGRLADATIFTTHEPCAMCVGALLASDVEALVYAVVGHARGRGRDRDPAGPAPASAAPDQGRQRDPPRRGRGPVRRYADRLTGAERPVAPARPGRPGSLWYPLPRRGVRVVDGAALEKRCAKAPRVRIPPSPPHPPAAMTPDARVAACAPRPRCTARSPDARGLTSSRDSAGTCPAVTLPSAGEVA